MWERMTEDTQEIFLRSPGIASRFKTPQIGTEHVLLALLDEQSYVFSPNHIQVISRSGKFRTGGLAIPALIELGIDPLRLKDELESRIPYGTESASTNVALTQKAKRVIDLAWEETNLLGNKYIDSEHILLGLIREYDGLAGQVLTSFGATLDAARTAVIKLQNQRERN